MVTDADLSLRLRPDDEWDVVRFLERANEALEGEPGPARAANLAAAEADYSGPPILSGPTPVWSEDRRRQLVRGARARPGGARGRACL